MRQVSNVYFDDSVYKEQICLHDIHLLSERTHDLLLCAYPETENFDDCLLEVDGPVTAERDGRHVRLTIGRIPGPSLAHLRLSSPTGGFQEEYRLHLYPAFDYADRIGTYVNPKNKSQRILLEKDGTVRIQTADLIDSLPEFSLPGNGMDSHSLELVLPDGKHVDGEGTEFTLTPYVRFVPERKALFVALLLEAYRDGFCDKAYLCGEGDEDGIIGYDSFEWREDE